MDNFGALTEGTQADLKALIDKIKAEGQAQS
jgi:hypothetical protein